MIAGTLIVRRKAGPLPGYLMRRGTIVLGEGAEALSPTFVDCGVHHVAGAASDGGVRRRIQPGRGGAL